MSKYALLVIINLPLILVGIISAITDYKASRIISRRKCIILVIFWLTIGVGLVMVEPFYNALIRANLTDSPPLSLIDVVQLTGLVLALFFIVKMYEKIDVLNQKLSRIHERLAMLDSEDKD
jgi:hypothetical protein